MAAGVYTRGGRRGAGCPRPPERPVLTSVSVVVPTLNEEQVLPLLLGALARQTRPAGELIVADGGSVDGTRKLAAAAGARVVAGGTPAVGRNRGGRRRRPWSSSWTPTSCRRAVPGGGGRRVRGAPAGRGHLPRRPPLPAVGRPRAARGHQRLLPGHRAVRAPRLRLLPPGPAVPARDHPRLRRAPHVRGGPRLRPPGAAHGRYAVLRRVAIPVSVRRLDQQGRVALVGAYVAAELRREVGQPGARLLRRHLGRRPARAGRLRETPPRDRRRRPGRPARRCRSRG